MSQHFTQKLINEGIDLGIGEELISDSESEYEEVSDHSKQSKQEDKDGRDSSNSFDESDFINSARSGKE